MICTQIQLRKRLNNNGCLLISPVFDNSQRSKLLFIMSFTLCLAAGWNSKCLFFLRLVITLLKKRKEFLSTKRHQKESKMISYRLENDI